MVGIKVKKAFLLVIILFFLSSGCGLRVFNLKEYNNKYSISVYYKPEQLSIFGTERLSYKNSEDVMLNNLYFHLYPNAFRKKETAPMIGDIRDNYPNGFNPGQIDIVNVWVGDKPVKWSVEGSDKTLLMIQFEKPLMAGEKAEVRIDFQEKLPLACTDFGSYDGIACFENWYPVLCVYDEDGWHKEPTCRMGEANFSEIADYIVDIDLPQNEVVAFSGKFIKEKKTAIGRKSVTLKADDVRDFTWISSSRFKKVEKKQGKITIKSYFLDEDKVRGVETLDFAARAFEFFNEKFGEYPYDSFSIVETYLYGGAMEYPMMTAVGRQYYKYPDGKSLEGAVAHEIAHQWWYVVVGNNEFSEPWLDESMATYSEAMYFDKYYGSDMMKQIINQRVGMTKFERSTNDSMDKFKTGSEYSLVVYSKGAYILDQFKKRVGDENFTKVLRKYYNDYKFKNACTDDFLGVVYEICGSAAAEFIKLGLSGIQ